VRTQLRCGAHGVPRQDRSDIGISEPGPLLAWLPSELHQPVGRLLYDRQRLTREALGLRILRGDPDLLTRAVD